MRQKQSRFWGGSGEKNGVTSFGASTRELFLICKEVVQKVLIIATVLTIYALPHIRTTLLRLMTKATRVSSSEYFKEYSGYWRTFPVS